MMYFGLIEHDENLLEIVKSNPVRVELFKNELEDFCYKHIN